MDIYKALKNGTHPEKLIEAYRKEIEAASRKIEQEEKEKEAAAAQAMNDALIAKHRDKLIDSTLEYAAALFGDKAVDPDMFDVLKNILIEFENSMSKAPIKFTAPNIKVSVSQNKSFDDDIIKSFLKLL